MSKIEKNENDVYHVEEKETLYCVVHSKSKRH